MGAKHFKSNELPAPSSMPLHAHSSIVSNSSLIGWREASERSRRESEGRPREKKSSLKRGDTRHRPSLMDSRFPTPLFPRKTSKSKKVQFFSFSGLMAPVFTCFENNKSCHLVTKNLDAYAAWLKKNKISGVSVNTVTGEGPALGLMERIANAEAWLQIAIKYDLVLMIQVGGAPITDVLCLTGHANDLGVDAILCLPEMVYRPKTINQLVTYCKLVAKRCPALPFFYYDYPDFTDVRFNMIEFCELAEIEIPNFYGIYYAGTDIDSCYRCLRDSRVVLLGASTLVASGMVLGFESIMNTTINIRPDLYWQIFNAMIGNDVQTAMIAQAEVNDFIVSNGVLQSAEEFVRTMKFLFNKHCLENDLKFEAGPARNLF